MPIAAIALCLLQARSTLVEPRPRPRTGKHIGHPDLHPPLSSVQDPRTTRDDVENGRETEIETFARPPEQTPVRSETRQSTHGTLHSTAVHARCPSSFLPLTAFAQRPRCPGTTAPQRSRPGITADRTTRTIRSVIPSVTTRTNRVPLAVWHFIPSLLQPAAVPCGPRHRQPRYLRSTAAPELTAHPLHRTTKNWGRRPPPSATIGKPPPLRNSSPFRASSRRG